ncbi:MAG: HD domain-containing protein [Clostridiales bacterium]|nr:HD domain-containing protein [Clostridiales bacterium]
MKDKKHEGLSIKLAAALNFVIVILVLTIVIVYIGCHLFEKHVRENYVKYAVTVLNNAYSITEYYSFGDMIASRNMPDSYEEMRGHLNKIKENSDIKYLYAIYFDDIDDIHSLTYAINTKTTEELENGGTYTYLGTPCEEGSFEDETLRILQETVRKGQKESSTLDGHSDEYGDMMNGYKVIFDSKGNPAGLLCVEIDTRDRSSEVVEYVRTVLIFASVFTLIITGIYIIRIEYSLLYPITSITNAAHDYIKNIGDQDAMDESAEKLTQLDIRSNNEIGDLYEAISDMETEMAGQLRDIRQYNEDILKLQNGLMILMADMVEVRDQDTGAHIQKTASYVKIILEGLKNKGYYEDILTPRFIEDVIKSAPLHDIGKINISDTILNKNGKLTDEEFEIMKTHTSSGKAILDKAISEVEGENFLREARNMAAYHHERWDGKGYPEGLAGDEIPLSARIMAVADVFDALTSSRIYKPPFPLSKAVKIIEEGKGTQFDPKCVEVMLEAMPQVKEVLRKLNPDYIEETDE